MTCMLRNETVIGRTSLTCKLCNTTSVQQTYEPGVTSTDQWTNTASQPVQGCRLVLDPHHSLVFMNDAPCRLQDRLNHLQVEGNKATPTLS